LKILHTSDIHLKEDSPERLDAFRKILSIATTEQVDLLVIAGDMFDSEEDADKSRNKLRNMLSGNSFKVLIIPGNHDQFAFRGDVHYGSDVTAVLETPYKTMDFDDVRIVAIPYSEKRIVDLVTDLNASLVKEKTNVLVAHCTLDLLGMSKEVMGDEQDCKYMPVSCETLRLIGFDYILAGHCHSSYKVYPIDSAKWFVYPGSPISITEKEQGKRSVNLLDTTSGLREISLDTPYFLTLRAEVKPGKEKEALESLALELQGHTKGSGIIDVEISGFIQMDENDFEKIIQDAVEPYQIRKIDKTYDDIPYILDDSLYKMYREEILRSKELDDDIREEMENLVLEAFISLKAQERGV